MLILGFDPLHVENPSFRGSGVISLAHYLHARLEEAQIPACSMGFEQETALDYRGGNPGVKPGPMA